MKFLIVLNFVLIGTNIFAQKILNRKEIKVKIETIQLELENENYEKAIGEFYSSKEKILEENVPKKMINEYHDLQNQIKIKKDELDYNQRKIDIYIDNYENQNYCSAIAVFDLTLTNTNSYVDTRIKCSALKSKLEQAKLKCTENSQKLQDALDLIKQNKYEPIFELYEIIEFDKSYFTSSDLKRIEQSKKILNEKYKEYLNISTEVDKEKNSLSQAMSKDLSSIELAKKTKSNLIKTKNDIENIVCNFPNLNSRIKLLIIDIDGFLKVIEAYLLAEITRKEQMKFYEEMTYIQNETTLIKKIKEAIASNELDVEKIVTKTNNFNWDDFRILSYNTPNWLEDKNGNIIQIYAYRLPDISYKTINRLLIQRAQKNALPIYVDKVQVIPNSAGMAEVVIEFANISVKKIKYIRFSVTYYNRVNDIVYCNITGNYNETLKATGPIETTVEEFNYEVWDGIYNYDASKVKFDKINIEYMDGSALVINSSQVLKIMSPLVFYFYKSIIF